MALDPNIPLQGKVPNVAEAINILDKERAIQNQRNLQQQQLVQNQQRLDLVGRNQESQQEIRDVKLEGLKIKNQQAEHDRQQRSMAVSALQLNRLKDPKAQEQFLMDRSERLKAEGKDSRETDEELQLLKSDPKKFNQDIDKAVQFSYDSGILKRQQTPSSVQEYEYVKKLSPEEKRVFSDLKRENKGIVFDEKTGAARAVEGYADVQKEIQKSKKTGELEAKKELAPSIAQAEEIAKNVGKADGIQINELNDRMSSQPRLFEVVEELSNLGKEATFTFTGRAIDAARRELGLPVGRGAVARTEYISKVDNEVLPLLRQTFGAQFTKEEGQSLKNTLGDPNKSPEEKEAVLKSFIAAKLGTIETLKRRTGQNTNIETQAPSETKQDLKDDPLNLFGD
jgi:hypothetical protein